MGRWTSTDPKAEFYDLYRYCTNPIGHVDPDGGGEYGRVGEVPGQQVLQRDLTDIERLEYRLKNPRNWGEGLEPIEPVEGKGDNAFYLHPVLQSLGHGLHMVSEEEAEDIELRVKMLEAAIKQQEKEKPDIGKILIEKAKFKFEWAMIVIKNTQSQSNVPIDNTKVNIMTH